MALSLDVLRDRSARLVFSGQLISQVCDKMTSVGLIWAITEEHSARWVPWFLGASALPHLLLAAHSGRVVARAGALRTVIASDAFRAALWLGLAASWASASQDARMPLLFAASFVSNVGSAFFNPAILTLPMRIARPELIQRLTALIDSCFSGGNVLGPWIATLLYPATGLRGIFVLNGLSYALAALLEARVRENRQSSDAGGAATETPSAPSLREALRADSLVRTMLGSFLLMNLFLAPAMIFLPLFVRNTYNGSIGALAWLESSFGAGTVLGSLLLTLLHLGGGTGKRIIGCLGLVALAYFGFAWNQELWIGCILIGILGASLAMANILILTLFQARPEPRLVPAVMSLVNLISVASLPLSMSLVGLIVERVGARPLAIALSSALLLTALAVATNRELRDVGSA